MLVEELGANYGPQEQDILEQCHSLRLPKLPEAEPRRYISLLLAIRSHSGAIAGSPAPRYPRPRTSRSGEDSLHEAEELRGGEAEVWHTFQRQEHRPQAAHGLGVPSDVLLEENRLHHRHIAPFRLAGDLDDCSLCADHGYNSLHQSQPKHVQ